ncbi:hypothetical protein BPJM79_70104 [Bacillus pumilus]
MIAEHSIVNQRIELLFLNLKPSYFLLTITQEKMFNHMNWGTVEQTDFHTGETCGSWSTA